jgi:hypothetical protein
MGRYGCTNKTDALKKAGAVFFDWPAGVRYSTKTVDLREDELRLLARYLQKKGQHLSITLQKAIENIEKKQR